MAFIENVPFARRTYNPEMAQSLKSVTTRWKYAQGDAIDRTNLFWNLTAERMPDYKLDEVDIEVIHEGIIYETAMDQVSTWHKGKHAVTVYRGIGQRYAAVQEQLKDRLNIPGEPLCDSPEKQTIYMQHARNASWAISNVYRNNSRNLRDIIPAAAPHIAIMRLLREGAPINISNLT